MDIKKDRKLCFVLPTTLGSSGGVTIVFKYAQKLNQLGYQCDVIYPIEPANINKWKNEKPDTFVKWCGTYIANIVRYNYRKFRNLYPEVKIVRVRNIDDVKKLEYETMIATAWDTAKAVNDSRAIHKMYFVQSFETWNGPEKLVLDTYKLSGLKFITISNFLRETLKQPCKIIYNPINITVPKEVNKSFDHLVFGVIYRPIKYKNFSIVVEILQRNPELRRNFCCVGMNIPTKYKKLFSKVFDGSKINGMKEFYSSINVLIYPSSNEGFGLPYLEAMQYGIIVISKKTGILHDIGTKSNFIDLNIQDIVIGNQITYADVTYEKLMKAINELSSMKQEALENISSEAKETFRRYSNNVSLDQNVKVFIEE